MNHRNKRAGVLAPASQEMFTSAASNGLRLNTSKRSVQDIEAKLRREVEQRRADAGGRRCSRTRSNGAGDVR